MMLFNKIKNEHFQRYKYKSCFFWSQKTICELKFLSKLGVVFKASNKAKITRKISVMSFETTDPSV